MLINEIYANLESVTESGCLVWTRCTNAKGYGRVRFHGKMHLVHRVVWEAVRGPIPPDLQIDHLCRVRRCGNVEHLELVTSRENTLRGESLAAQRARQTHCKRGHELSGENLYSSSQNRAVQRTCRTCHIATQKSYRAQRRAAAQVGCNV